MGSLLESIAYGLLFVVVIIYYGPWAASKISNLDESHPPEAKAAYGLATLVIMFVLLNIVSKGLLSQDPWFIIISIIIVYLVTWLGTTKEMFPSWKHT